jgi:hypothetical protein
MDLLSRCIASVGSIGIKGDRVPLPTFGTWYSYLLAVHILPMVREWNVRAGNCKKITLTDVTTTMHRWNTANQRERIHLLV